MKIGIAGPISLNLLNAEIKKEEIPEKIYSFPFTANLVNSLIAEGNELVVYTFAWDIKKSMVLKKKNLTICIAPRSHSPGRNFFKKEINTISQLMIDHPAEIINAQWSYEFALASFKSKLPNVITVRDHATTILKYEFDVYRIVRWLLNYKVMSNAKNIIANSYYLHELISKKKYNLAVVPNFYNAEIERFWTSTKTDSKKIISICNGFGKRKNIKTALNAFKLIYEKFPGLEYHIIGKGMHQGGEAYNYAKKNNLLQGVYFRGPLSFDNVLNEIKDSKISLHPSREETFGNTVLESMVVGTPVVAGEKSGNIPYLLNNGKAGILCNINSPQSIFNGVVKLMTDSILYNEIRKAAKEFAHENYSEKEVIKSLIAFYNKVLEMYK